MLKAYQNDAIWIFSTGFNDTAFSYDYNTIRKRFKAYPEFVSEVKKIGTRYLMVRDEKTGELLLNKVYRKYVLKG